VHSLLYSVLLIECQSYNLSLRLKKMRIFPPRVEFVGVDVSTPGGTLPAQACTPWVIAKTCWYSGCVSVHWLWPILCMINSQFRALDFCTSQYYRSWLFTASWQFVDTVGSGRIWRHLKIYIGWSMYQAIWFYHQAGHFTYSVFLLWLWLVPPST